jgi:protein-tyrosine phosphatase
MNVPPLADLHSHVLPAVDDGAVDLEGALRTLEALEADGVTAICATPHLRASASPDSERRLRADAAWAELTAAGSDRPRGLRLHRGFEVLLDAVPDADDPQLRLAGTSYMLVEWASFTVPDDSEWWIERLVAAGIKPVIAHAERYFGYRGDYEVVGEWRRRGALVQVNSGSLSGEHGEGAGRQAEALFARGWVDLLASDTHARPDRNPSVRDSFDALASRGAAEHAELLLSVNPRRILEDAPTVPVPPLEGDEG